MERSLQQLFPRKFQEQTVSRVFLGNIPGTGLFWNFG